jgi:hypothetical protein
MVALRHRSTPWGITFGVITDWKVVVGALMVTMGCWGGPLVVHDDMHYSARLASSMAMWRRPWMRHHLIREYRSSWVIQLAGVRQDSAE